MDERSEKTAGMQETARGGRPAAERRRPEAARTRRQEEAREAARNAERAAQRAREDSGEEISAGERRTQGERWSTAEEWKGRRWREGEEILGRYVVERELGQGGMGVVYGCLDKVGGVRVAVKALPPELGHDAAEMEDVRENFELVGGLRHPNIAGVRTLEKDEKGEYYLVMDVAEGESLRKWIRRKWKAGGAGLGETLGVLRQVAAALDYAHGEKVVHRDVKPGNVIIDGRGRVKVLDFGLAAQIRTSLSRASQAYRGTSGTGSYMAPEQWEGKPQGGKADQYALAVMAYEMLAGRLPFENGEWAVLREAVLRGKADPIPGLPKRAMAALRKAMAKRAEDRFGSCGAFVEALEGGRRNVCGKPLAGWLAALGVAAAVAWGVWAMEARRGGGENDGTGRIGQNEITEAKTGGTDVVPEAEAGPVAQEVSENEERLTPGEGMALLERETPRGEQEAAPFELVASGESIKAAVAGSAAMTVGGGQGGVEPEPPTAAEAWPEEASIAKAMVPAREETPAEAYAGSPEVPDEPREEIAPMDQVLAVRTKKWADKDGGWLYFEVEMSRAVEEALPVLPKDVLLVLDRSWSINPSKFDYFKEGLVEFLKTLRRGDRVNVMRYSENAEFCFEGWAPATEENLTQAARYVKETRREGKTDLYASLRTMLDVPRDPRRPLLAVLLTDGRATAGVLENSDIISRFSRLNAGNVSVFTVGAGDNVNRFLLDMLGQFNRGGTWYREDHAQLPEAMRQAARGLARPVLADLKWRLSPEAGAEAFPADLPHLYLDRPLRLTGRCPLGGARGTVLRVEGVSEGKTFDMAFPLDWENAECGGEEIRRQWERFPK